MKKLTVIALSLLTAGAAMAQGLSREQVVAELVRARASGELAAMNSEDPSAFGRLGVQAGASKLGRDAVVAELKRARAAGELAGLDSETDTIPQVATVSTKTRAEVLAELQRARASGELELLNSNNPSYAQLAAIQQPAKAATEKLAGQPARAQ